MHLYSWCEHRRNMLSKLILLSLAPYLFYLCDGNVRYSRPKRWAFDTGSGMGLFLALALPIDVPRRDVYVAFNFEANYLLPNASSFIKGPALGPTIEQRSRFEPLNRTLAYQLIEAKMESVGWPGRECLLRAICETAESTMDHNGVLGQVVHVLFGPSSSEQEDDLPVVYFKAESQGRTMGDCNNYIKTCSISLLDLFTQTQII